MRRLAAIVAVLAVLGTSPAAAASGDCTPGADWPAASGAHAAQVVALVNAHRAELGLGPLSTLGSLGAAASWKARHMAMYTYMAHDDPAPPVDRSVGERLAACGYAGGAWGENVAYGYPSAEAVVAAWLASPGHRANIENGRFTAIGVAAATSAGGAVYWAQEFGVSSAPPASVPPPDPEPDPEPDPVPQPQPDPEPDPDPDPEPQPGPEPEPQPEPAAEPEPEPDVTSEPTVLRVQRGRVSGGALESLGADDGRMLALRSRGGRTAWSASAAAPEGDHELLRLLYRGSSSARCNQEIALWSVGEHAWVNVDTRRVGGREVAVEIEVEAARFAGADVRVRVTCARPTGGAFTTRADLLQLAWS